MELIKSVEVTDFEKAILTARFIRIRHTPTITVGDGRTTIEFDADLESDVRLRQLIAELIGKGWRVANELHTS